ncbi:MAG: restriction endonuclease subunit S [Zoogloea sp.]|nr:restriction endonuclease subunit S [Zoogloea sp.]
MNAPQVADASRDYLTQLMPPLVRHFDLLAGAPQGVARLRELILSLAVRGMLVPQDMADEPASALLERIRTQKDKLIAEGTIKRDTPLSVITEEEQPFNLPDGWAWVKLNQLLSKIGAGSTPLGGKEVYVPSGVKFLRSQNVWNDGLRLSDVAYIKAETHSRMSGTAVTPGDILFNITGASIGRCAVVPGDFDEANVSQHVTIIRPVMAAVTSYLHLVLVSAHVQQTVMDVQVGVSREGLSIGKLGQFLIPVPPLPEQARIVAKVKELMTFCDLLEEKGRLEAEQHRRLVATLFDSLISAESPHELAERWQRVAAHFDLLLDRPEAVDVLEQTVLQLAVRGLLVPQDPADEPASHLLERIRSEKDRLIAAGKIKRDKSLASINEDETPFELPNGWGWGRLGEVTDISSGVTLGRKTPLKSPVSLPYLRVANVQRWKLVLQDVKEVVIDAFELERFQLRTGDLLMTEGGDWDKVGRTCIWRNELPTCLHQNHVFKVRRVFDEWQPLWAELYLNSTYARAYFASSAKQTTNLASINMTQLKSCVFPIPPLAEQARIIARVEELRRLCADLRARLSHRKDIQRALSAALVEQVAA